MERTQAFPRRSGPLQLDRAADDLDDVDTGEQVVDEGGGNHRASLRRRALSPAVRDGLAVVAARGSAVALYREVGDLAPAREGCFQPARLQSRARSRIRRSRYCDTWPRPWCHRSWLSLAGLPAVPDLLPRSATVKPYSAIRERTFSIAAPRSCVVVCSICRSMASFCAINSFKRRHVESFVQSFGRMPATDNYIRVSGRRRDISLRPAPPRCRRRNSPFAGQGTDGRAGRRD